MTNKIAKTDETIVDNRSLEAVDSSEESKELEPFEELIMKSNLFDKIIITLLIVCLLISGLLIYRYLPFYQKIAGEWSSETEVGFHLTNNKNRFTLSQSHPSEAGMTYIYKGDWKRKGINKYQGIDLTVQIIIDKSKYTEEQLIELRNETDVFRLESEKKTELILAYTEKSLSSMFNSSDPSKYFTMTLIYPTKGSKNNKLEWNSSYFSNEIIYLEKTD